MRVNGLGRSGASGPVGATHEAVRTTFCMRRTRLRLTRGAELISGWGGPKEARVISVSGLWRAAVRRSEMRGALGRSGRRDGAIDDP